MHIITGEKRVEIDVAKITRTIDSALDDEITDKTGIVISHDTIIATISETIRKHNHEELRLWYAIEQEDIRLEKEKNEIADKVKSGKVVGGTDTFIEWFKYHVIGYVYVGEEDKNEKND